MVEHASLAAASRIEVEGGHRRRLAVAAVEARDTAASLHTATMIARLAGGK
jgi:hypothetical protein